MQHIKELDLKVVGTRAFVLNSEWPKQLSVERPIVEALSLPVGIAFGRRGALMIETANGTARYQRSSDIAGGWSYVLTESTKIIPVAPDPPPAPADPQSPAGGAVEATQNG